MQISAFTNLEHSYNKFVNDYCFPLMIFDANSDLGQGTENKNLTLQRFIRSS